MEVIIPFFFIAFIVVAVAIGIAAAASQSKNLKEAFGQLARAMHGTMNDGGWFNRPSVHFPHAGSWVTVDIYSTGGKHPTYYTQVNFDWPHAGFRCEVYPEGFFNRIGKFLGMQDIEIGSPGFDEQYIITGDDVASLRGVLNAKVQSTIRQLQQLSGNNHIYVGFNGGKLLVKKLGMISNFATLHRLALLATQLYDEAHSLEGSGIEFVEGPAAAPAEEVMCQICGDGIESNRVRCVRCETPHHADCWNYYGGCSTYGCGEKRYRRPKQRKKSRQ